MINRKNLKLKPIAIAVALAATGIQVQADEELLEEIVVTGGYRASLERAMDLKRDYSGVMDAISAEDIGKFPDTNLAESLQRITGVSISRQNGEGQQITVRGFGPQFNAITLNGRQMPNATSGRGFNFDTVAAEMVSGVQVYKSSVADVVSGGVGATVNVTTARPLVLGDKIAGSIKGLHDDAAGGVTPDASGIYSKVIDDKFGILVSASYQERDTSTDSIEVKGWRNLRAEGNNPYRGVDRAGNPTENYARPTQTSVRHTENNSERLNANLVLQAELSDSVTATLDANYSDLEVTGKELDSALWYGFWGEFVAEPDAINGTMQYAEVGNRNLDMFVNKPYRKETSDQIGFNLKWDISDQSTVSFDYANSGSKTDGDTPEISRASLQIQGLPQDGLIFQRLPNGVTSHFIDNSDVTLANAVPWMWEEWFNDKEDEIDQVRVDYNFEDGSLKLQAGMMMTNQKKSLIQWKRQDDQSWQGALGYLIGDHPNAVYATVEEAEAAGFGTTTIDHEFLGSLTFLDFNPDEGQNWGNAAGYTMPIVQNAYSVIEEDTLSFYAQVTNDIEIGDHALTISGGVRVENTSIDSTSFQRELLDLVDQGAGAPLGQVFAESSEFTSGDDYDVLLPNFSIKYELTDDMVVRFAASQTITRPELKDMQSARSLGSIRPGQVGSGSGGNPDLKPFMSDNLDFSVEYYIDEVSYVSAGYFRKVVDNFIVRGAKEEGSGIIDPTTGNEAIFLITRPRNEETKTVDGIELTAQYAFGDSGFGFIANATFTDSDSPFSVDQFDESALLGLSDSLNLVGYFENDILSARIAYNWRDEYVQKWGHFYGTTTGEPTQVEDYGQYDISVSYNASENVTVFLEGINITGEDSRTFSRFSEQQLTLSSGSARYALGIRASF